MQDVNPRAVSSLPVLINGMPRSQTPFPPPTSSISGQNSIILDPRPFWPRVLKGLWFRILYLHIWTRV